MEEENREVTTGQQQTEKSTQDQEQPPPPYQPPGLAPESSSQEQGLRAQLGAQKLQQPQFVANETLLRQIESFGFTRIAGEKALYYSGNHSADLAVEWLLDNPTIAEDTTPLVPTGQFPADDQGWEDTESSDLQVNVGDQSHIKEFYSDMVSQVPMKMMLVVNTALKMGNGKMAAQVAHATLGLYQSLADRPGNLESLTFWQQEGETKIVVKAQDDNELNRIQKASADAGLGTYMVRDAGRTQIPAGSQTVLGIFGPDDKLKNLGLDKLELL